MNKPNFLFAFCFLTILLIASACEKDDAGTVHKITYQITGNFSGRILAALTGANGSFITREITKLPWEEEITLEANTKTINASATGTGGATGQQASFKIYDNGKEVASGSGTAISPGIITLNPQSYTIK
jgi:hypothetical protein